jgi:cytochrome d ubiquinol oxidase subunit I
MTDVQPMKMASAEALYDTSDTCAPFSIFTIGTPNGKEPKFEIRVPCLLSFLATGHFDQRVQGINNLRAEYQQTYGQDPTARYYSPGDFTPIIPVTYWSFRWMMGLGAVGALGGFLLLWITRKGRAPTVRWFTAVTIAVPVMVLLANSVGWLFTEMGRQPWVVFGLMTTRNAVSPGVSTTEAWISILGLCLIYLVLAIVTLKLLVMFIKKGADPYVEPPEPKWRHRGDDHDDTDHPLDFAY